MIFTSYAGHHDTEHDYTQHNNKMKECDTQWRSFPQCGAQCVAFFCGYADCRTERHYTELRDVFCSYLIV